MSQTTPLRPPAENNNSPWLLEGLLPRNQVVLIDGSAAVGKTALLALLTRRLLENNNKRTILYLTSNTQSPSRDLFLLRQKASFSQLHAVHFEHQDALLQSRSIYLDLINCIGQALQEKKPHCLMIDGLDELLEKAPDADSKLSRQFWNALHAFAEQFQCTIIVTRNQGFHESRAYGHLTRTGSDLCHFALAMHWHPHATAQRIITVARHRTGPIGKQFHLKFTGNHAELFDMQESQHLRPAKTPPHHLPPKPARQHQQKPVEQSNTVLEPVHTTSSNPPRTINYENRAHEQTARGAA